MGCVLLRFSSVVAVSFVMLAYKFHHESLCILHGSFLVVPNAKKCTSPVRHSVLKGSAIRSTAVSLSKPSYFSCRLVIIVKQARLKIQALAMTGALYSLIFRCICYEFYVSKRALLGSYDGCSVRLDDDR